MQIANTIDHGTRTHKRSRRVQAAVGLGLAAGIFAAWASIHVWAIFFFDWRSAPVAAPFVTAVLCWLYVGLFIIAHDCMHGSLVPGNRTANVTVGRIALFCYAGFSFDRLNPAHHDHHRFAGTDGDPDFDDRHPHGFWPWYLKFIGEYISWRQPIVMGTVVSVYYFVFKAEITNILFFLAFPAWLSSLQLFAFGTYLPHVPDDKGAFADGHRARSSSFGWLLSLLTCYHFGYHLEHHLRPKEPWWRLPETRANLTVKASNENRTLGNF